MAAAQSTTDYLVLLAERADGYELHIRELLLWVKGPDLQLAYAELMKRKQELMDWARLVGALDDLPIAQPSPAIATS